MLNLFKKQDVPKEEQPLGSTLPVFEEGRERTFKDPKTGEFVSQRMLSSDHRKLLMDKLQKNGGQATQAIQMFRQLVGLLRACLKVDDEIVATEKEINDAMNKVRDDLKLDRRWGLNPNLMILEKREPPDGT